MSEEAAQGLDLTAKEVLLIQQMHSSLEKSSHYTLLGVPEDASSKQIRNAYYEMSRHWHPDRFFRREIGDYGPQIEAIFSAVTEAYQTLTDQTRRSAYDRELEKLRSERPKRAVVRPAPVAAPASGTAPATDPVVAPDIDDALPPAAEATEPTIEAAPRSRTSRRTRPTPGRSRYRRRVMDQVRKDVRDSSRRARRYHEAGQKDLAEGNAIKAESALYLAVKLDPKNPTYRADFEEAQRQARQIRARQFIVAAESAEQYQNVQEALYNYRKAVEYHTDEAKVFYRLGQLIRRVEKDDREALKAIRTATLKDPENPEYRIALAEMYAEQGLALNARREYQEASRLAKDKETRSRARDGLRQLR